MLQLNQVITSCGQVTSAHGWLEFDGVFTEKQALIKSCTGDARAATNMDLTPVTHLQKSNIDFIDITKEPPLQKIKSLQLLKSCTDQNLTENKKKKT